MVAVDRKKKKKSKNFEKFKIKIFESIFFVLRYVRNNEISVIKDIKMKMSFPCG